MDGVWKYLKYLLVLVALASMTNAAPTRPAKALSICDGEDLSEQLQVVCAELKAKEEEELVKERIDVYPKCKEIIEPDLRELCIQLEVAKGRQAVNVTSDSNEVEVPPALVNITTPMPKPVSKEHPGRGKGKDQSSEEKTTLAPETTTTTKSRLEGIFGNLLSQFQESDNPLASLFNENGLSNIAEQVSNSDMFKQFQRLLGNNGMLSDMAQGLGQLDAGDLREAFVDLLKQQGFDVSNVDMSQFSGLLGGLQSDSGLNNVLGNGMGAWGGRLMEIWRANEIGLNLDSQSPLLSLVNRLVDGRHSFLGNSTQTPPPLTEIPLVRPHPLEAKSNSSSEDVEKLIPINRGGNPLRPSVDLRNIDMTKLPVQPPRLGMVDPEKLNGLISTELRNQGLAQILRNMGGRFGAQISTG